ncbi:hypothetical protein SH501x_002297 [Pirellulaceae bacterium SH501]
MRETADSMNTLCCQIQIDRLATITEERVNDICRALAARNPNINFESGEDDGRYVNLFVESYDAVAAWDLIETTILSDGVIGPEMRTAAIVTITGRNGWDDYLLLHHFDPSETLDTIENPG